MTRGTDIDIHYVLWGWKKAILQDQQDPISSYVNIWEYACFYIPRNKYSRKIHVHWKKRTKGRTVIFIQQTLELSDIFLKSKFIYLEI